MKYDSLRKLERNHDIIEFRRQYPELSLAEIAKKFSVSRQRIHQIIKIIKKESNHDNI